MADEWTYELIPGLAGGYVEGASETLENNQSPAMSNMAIRNGRIVSDNGYLQVGSATLRGDPKIIFEAVSNQSQNVRQFILGTTECFYWWNISVDEWHYFSDTGDDTNLSSGASATDTVISVDDASGFSDGDYIGIELDDDNQHQTTVNGAPSGNDITLTDAMPSAAAGGSIVVKSQDFTLNVSGLPWSWTHFYADGWVVVTDAATKIWAITISGGSTPPTIQELPGSPPAEYCTAVATFKNYLLLIGTTESSTTRGYRVRRSDEGDGSAWTGGNSGYTDVVFDGRSDHIRGSFLHNNIVYLPRFDSIVRMRWTGKVNEIFAFDTLNTERGVFNGDCISSMSGQPILADQYGIYSFNGAVSPLPISDQIVRKFFRYDYGQDTEPRADLVEQSRLVHVSSLDEIWYMPSVAFATDQIIAKYSRLDGGWTIRTIDEDLDAFLSVREKVWISGTNEIYSYETGEDEDDGTAIAWNIETKDFAMPGWKFKVDSIYIFSKGTATISYSLDQGATFTSYGSVSHGSSFGSTRLNKQILGYALRLKLSGTVSDFELGWMTIKIKRESET